MILDSKWHMKRRNRGAGRWWFALWSRVEVLKALAAGQDPGSLLYRCLYRK